jgi:hypothetical protein
MDFNNQWATWSTVEICGHFSYIKKSGEGYMHVLYLHSMFMEGKKKTVTVVISEEGNWNPRSHIGRNFG